MNERVRFRVAGLIAKPDADRVGETLEELCRFLTKRGVALVPETHTARLIPDLEASGVSLESLGQHIDFAVVVGGDGTLLGAARALAPFNIPILGVNLGRLGFLADVSPSHLVSRLAEVLDGACTEESRFLLTANVIRRGECIFEQTAVNDVVVHRSNATSMIEMVTHVDGVFLNTQRSDGLIVSTPTGSTAYALSVGGPILAPSLRALVLAPINPHALTMRPIVVDSESVIGITFRPGRHFAAQVICDSVTSPELEVDDRVEIRYSGRCFRLLHPEDYDFFEILRAKLNWSSGQPV
jgi:NAD+ kinase